MNKGRDMRHKMRGVLVALHRDEEGMSTTESTLILFLLVCMGVVFVKIFGARIIEEYTAADAQVSREGGFF